MIRSSKSGSDVRNKFLGSGEMIQSLEGLSALSEDPGLVPSTHSSSRLSVTLVLGDLTLIYDLCGHQTHT